ncbi:MAG TPA: hypothetical protein VLT33_27895 [Labilithrix sp.]|nr:hypothetical protein [Labilithrix sp.]
MSRSSLPLLLVLATSSAGCAMLAPHGGGGGAQAPATASNAPAYTVPKESQDLVRKGEQDAYARADEAADEQLDKLEKDALLAVRVSLGKDKWSENQPAPLPASQGLLALRKQNVKMKLEPVVNGMGGTSDDFLQLKDEATDRLAALGRKSAEGTATAAEKREMMAYSKIAFKLMDLKMQVSKISVAALTANSNVQTSSLTTMLRVSGLVRSHKTYNMEMTAEDYGLVKRGLERQRRAEAIAATTMAMLAAYQAVINNGGDPKALEIIGDGTLKAFPLKPTVTDEEAKAYVSGLGANVQKVKARYEAQMRKTWGDAKYERQYKAGIDAMFAQAEGASSAKSVTQIAADTNSKYKIDVGKCMRGEPVDPGSMVGGGTCSSLRKAAQGGDTSDLPPGALAAFRENGGASAGSGAGGAGAGPGVPGLPRNAKNALDTASSIAAGDASSTFDNVAKFFPGDTTIGASLQGISALKNGDPRGAINAALTFVPVPGLKDVFGIASKLLFKS